jgi:hypothetical protein
MQLQTLSAIKKRKLLPVNLIKEVEDTLMALTYNGKFDVVVLVAPNDGSETTMVKSTEKDIARFKRKLRN